MIMVFVSSIFVMDGAFNSVLATTNGADDIAINIDDLAITGDGTTDLLVPEKSIPKSKLEHWRNGDRYVVRNSKGHIVSSSKVTYKVDAKGVKRATIHDTGKALKTKVTPKYNKLKSSSPVTKIKSGASSLSSKSHIKYNQLKSSSVGTKINNTGLRIKTGAGNFKTWATTPIEGGGRGSDAWNKGYKLGSEGPGKVVNGVKNGVKSGIGKVRSLFKRGDATSASTYKKTPSTKALRNTKTNNSTTKAVKTIPKTRTTRAIRAKSTVKAKTTSVRSKSPVKTKTSVRSKSPIKTKTNVRTKNPVKTADSVKAASKTRATRTTKGAKATPKTRTTRAKSITKTKAPTKTTRATKAKSTTKTPDKTIRTSSTKHI